MNRQLVLFGSAALVIAELLSAGGFAPARADASAASVAMGGIRFRKESRISMDKERLSISMEQIKVEYEFLNQTSQDITTDVAFPLADRSCNPWRAENSEDLYGYSPAFQLWIEGKAWAYKTETQALLDKQTYTDLLQKLGIDIETCGHYQSGVVPDFAKLSKENLQRLSTLGLLSPDGTMPRWTVRQFYYWKQTFPANRTVHVMHTYKPGVGFSEQIAVSTLYLFQAERGKQQKQQRDWDDPGGDALDESCLKPTVARKIAQDWAGPDYEQVSGYVFLWVDYILKTGNNWQGPIKDFELNVEQPKGWWVDFCWKGPVERLGPGHVRVKLSDFSPSQNLHILFLPDSPASPD